LELEAKYRISKVDQKFFEAENLHQLFGRTYSIRVVNSVIHDLYYDDDNLTLLANNALSKERKKGRKLLKLTTKLRGSLIPRTHMLARLGYGRSLSSQSHVDLRSSSQATNVMNPYFGLMLDGPSLS